VLVAASSNLTVRKRLVQNMMAQPHLDWGVVLYDGHISEWSDVVKLFEQRGRKLLLRQGSMPDNQTIDNHTFIPKLWVQQQVVDWLPGYAYVWLSDEDINFRYFNYAEFWRVHSTSFPDGPPLVAQPTIEPSTQYASLLNNHEQWPKTTVGAVTTYVEQQTPILDAQFWKWLVTTPQMEALRHKQVELGVDWVTDHVWCPAAYEWIANRSVSRTACGMITVPIDHDDTDTSGWRSNNTASQAFVDKGIKLTTWASSEQGLWLDTTPYTRALQTLPVGAPKPNFTEPEHYKWQPPATLQLMEADVTGPGLAGPGLTGSGVTGSGLKGPGLTGPGLAGPGLKRPGLTEPLRRSSLLRGNGSVAVGTLAPALARIPKTLVLVAASSNLTVRKRLVQNMMAQPHLDWGVVLYDGHISEWSDVVKLFEQRGRKLLLRQGSMPDNQTIDNHTFIPKLWVQQQVVDWLPGYAYVWLSDEDINFRYFNYAEFWRVHSTSFPDGPPLVAQPTIEPSTQYASLLNNHEQWPKTTVGAVTTYVEQQTPILDAQFWKWLVTTPQMEALRHKQVELGVDWVTDHVWCPAAYEWIANRSVSRTACGMITVPIDHDDTDTCGWKNNRTKLVDFATRGKNLEAWACSVNMSGMYWFENWTLWADWVPTKVQQTLPVGAPGPSHTAPVGAPTLRAAMAQLSRGGSAAHL